MTHQIEQTVEFDAASETIYNLITDEEKHTAFTGMEAKIDNTVGGKFTAYAGNISGENTELVPHSKISQKWRGEDWEKGIYSTLTYSLTEKDGKTTVKFTQNGVPDPEVEKIAQGWHDFYWNKINEYLEKS
ncbi:MAG: SRPBCC domain-containing protein [Candidatus Heimdallarchaeota archaeon]|nr:SRPBCC domain-containing protein [Candidatus Heimdallarchaeota archaeon]